MDSGNGAIAPVALAGASFSGWALSPHLQLTHSTSGLSRRRRTPLADMVYRYRFLGDRTLLGNVAALYVRAVPGLFAGSSFEGIVMPPAPVESIAYATGMALLTEVAKQLRLVPLQQGVVCSNQHTGPGSNGGVSLSCTAARSLFRDRSVLVITDFVRSAKSLAGLCTLLREAGTRELAVLAATTLQVQR